MLFRSVAYILNKKEFWSKFFNVTKDTLIPRPETELMVDKLIKRYKNKKNISILDIGTGSGCIIISLLSELSNSFGVGIDISYRAIKIAKKNAINHCIDRKIKSISEEMYKRLIVPIYIIIISLISACLVLKPKYSHFIKYQKLLVFFLGFSIIIVSEISFKFIKQIKLLDFSSVLFPIFLVIVYYLYLLLKSNFKIKYL